METRINIHEKGQQALKALYGLGAYLAKSPLDKTLLHMVYYRVSQINGCAYCLDMHSKDFIEAGEPLQRLLVLDAWREAPFYSDSERAALAYAEAVTKIPNGHVWDDVYAEALKQFGEQGLIDLTVAVLAINSYNRINITFSQPQMVGTYVPGMFAPAK